MTSTDLYLAPKPFSPHVERCQFPVGWSVARSLTQLVNDGKLALDDVPLVRVYVQGLPLMAEDALDYVAQDGDVINVVVEPQGGETGKTIFQLFYTIGAAVVSYYFGPVWGAVVSIAGAALTQMIWRPEKGLPDGKGGSSLSSQGNSNRQRQMMPLALGRQRVALDLAALPFTQNIGGDVWMTVAFGIHYGPCTLDSIKIGETLLSDYPAQDVQVEQFLAPGPRQSALYPTRVAQENRQNKLDFTGGGVWEVGTFAAGADYGEVDITLPSGLKYNADSGKTRNEEVTGRIEYAAVGTENWAPVPTISGYRNKNNQPLPVGTWFLNLKTNDAVRRTFRWPLPADGQQYKFRAKAWDADGDFPTTDGRIWDTYLTAIRSVFNEPAFIDQNLSILVLKIKSSDDLNGQLPPITAVVEPICPVFTNGAWGNPQPTSNPAAMLRWLLNGPAPARPLAPEEFDASLAAQYQLIEQRGWKGAYWVQDDVSQEELIIALGRMGRFSAYWNGEALCVVPDWEKPVARQLFTGRNVEGYRYSRSFPEPIHAVFVEFRNLDADSRGDELWVYADGYTAETAQTFVQHRLDFACTADRAFREGRVFLAKYELQVETHEWTSGVDSIVSSFGDRVRVRHPVGLVGLGEARVQFRRREGGLVSGVRLDQTVTMEAGKSYGIDVRTADDGLILNIPVVTAPGETRELAFPAARAVDLAPAPGDLIAFGEMNLVTEDVELVDVAPESDGTAKLRAVKYLAAEIEAAETGPVPELPTLLKPIIPAPVPRFIGEPDGDPAGARMAFDVDPQRADQIAGFAARVRRVSAQGPGDWAPLPMLPPSARQVTTGPFPDAASQPGDADPDYVVQIDIRTIMVSGDPSQRAVSPNIVIQRGVQTPKGVVAAGVSRTASDGAKYPALYIEAQAVEAGAVQDLVVEVQEVGQADWVSAGQPLPAANPVGDMLNVQGGRSYLVRARWRTADNWVSAWVTTQTPVLIPTGNVSSDTINVGGVPAQDVVSATQAVGQIQLDLAEARATLYTATTGLVDQTAALFSSLNTPTTGVLARLTSAETAITANNNAAVQRLNAIETTLNAAGTGVVARLGVLENVVSTPTTGLVSRLTAMETQINTPSTGILARLLVNESAITNLTTGKADASRVTALEARGVTLPNMIEDGRFNRPLGEVWYKEGGEGPSVLYDAQIGSYLHTDGQYLVSKPYLSYAGAIMSVSWSGIATNAGAHLYLQALPSYEVMARAYRNAANNWGQRYTSDGATYSAPAGTTGFRVVIDPAGGGMDVSSVKVNYGAVSTFWSDEKTQREINASIKSLEAVTSDLQNSKASATRVTVLEATVRSLPNLLLNSNFSQINASAAADSRIKNWFSTGDFVLWSYYYDSAYGALAGALGGAQGQNFYLISDKVPVYGSTAYTLSFAGDGGVFPDTTIVYVTEFGAGDVNIQDGTGAVTFGGVSWTARKSTTFVTQPGTQKIAVVIYKPGAVNGQSFNAFISRVQLNIGETAAGWNEEASDRAVAARLTVTESAVTDLYGRTYARFAIGASVPGADAFIFAQAETTPGQAPTSNVAIGARIFAVYNQVGQNWVKALEVVNGNAIFSGGLQAGAFIRLGNGNGWPVALRPVDFNLTDGEVCSFGTDLGGLPAVSMAYNNLAPLNSGETYDVRPINLTATGFTLYAKINVPAATSDQTANTTKANVTLDGYPGVQLYLDGKPESADGTYRIQAQGIQTHRFSGKQGQAVEADSYSYAYTTIQVWAYKGGWVQVALGFAESVVDPYQYSPGQFHTASGGWSYDETVQLGSGVTYVAVVRTNADNNLSGYVSTVGPVSWQAQGAASGVRSATPGGQKTRVTVRPQ